MTTPTPPQLERLKEIVSVSMPLICSSAIRTRAELVALTVWREAQEEKKSPWYSAEEMRHWLIRKDYAPVSADELAADYARNLQQAFEKGQSCSQFSNSCDHSEIYEKEGNCYCGKCHNGMGNAYYANHIEKQQLEASLETAKRILNAQELRLRELGENPSEAIAVIGEPVHPAILERTQLEASLKLAVEALEIHKAWKTASNALSTIRTNHPQIFPEVEK